MRPLLKQALKSMGVDPRRARREARRRHLRDILKSVKTAWMDEMSLQFKVQVIACCGVGSHSQIRKRVKAVIGVKRKRWYSGIQCGVVLHQQASDPNKWDTAPVSAEQIYNDIQKAYRDAKARGE